MRLLSLSMLVLTAFSAYGAESVGGGCYATCRPDKDNPSESCSVSRIRGQQSKAVSNKPEPLEDCMTMKSEKGNIGVLFRVGGKQGNTVVREGNAFSDKLAVYKALDCLVGDSSICGTGQLVATLMGKGFDPAAPSEITGQPCALALPCGKVGLAPNGSLPIRLAESSTEGALALFAARGDATPQRVEVRSGSAVVPTGTLKPGQTYRYRLTKADGSVRAAGEFQIMSQRAQADSDAALADAVKAKGEEGAIESLMLDGRDWEAFQRTRGGAK